MSFFEDSFYQHDFYEVEEIKDFTNIEASSEDLLLAPEPCRSDKKYWDLCQITRNIGQPCFSPNSVGDTWGRCQVWQGGWGVSPIGNPNNEQLYCLPIQFMVGFVGCVPCAQDEDCHSLGAFCTEKKTYTGKASGELVGVFPTGHCLTNGKLKDEGTSVQNVCQIGVTIPVGEWSCKKGIDSCSVEYMKYTGYDVIKNYGSTPNFCSFAKKPQTRKDKRFNFYEKLITQLISQ